MKNEKYDDYNFSRDDVLKATGWSPATLFRKTNSIPLFYEERTGKTKAERWYSETQINEVTGVIEAELVDESLEIKDKKLEKSLMKMEKNQNISRNNSELIQVKKRNNSELIQNISELDVIKNALILPHKIFLSLDEAKALTGLPKTFLRGLAVKFHGRVLIRKSDLENISLENII